MKNQSAFPHKGTLSTEDGVINIPTRSTGMSLRDYFAGQVMIGLLSAKKDVGIQALAEESYRIANFMLEEREKHEE